MIFFIFPANGFQFLFRSCRDNELRYLLTFVQTTLTSLTYGEKENVFICFLVLAFFDLSLHVLRPTSCLLFLS